METKWATYAKLGFSFRLKPKVEPANDQVVKWLDEITEKLWKEIEDQFSNEFYDHLRVYGWATYPPVDLSPKA